MTLRLGSSQQARFERLGEMADLEYSICNLRRAEQLTDEGHPDKAIYLAHLGDALIVSRK